MSNICETSAAGLSQIVLDDQLRGSQCVPYCLPYLDPCYPESAPGVKETLRYMLSEKSQAKSDALGYVPLPEDLVVAVDSIN